MLAEQGLHGRQYVHMLLMKPGLFPCFPQSCGRQVSIFRVLFATWQCYLTCAHRQKIGICMLYLGMLAVLVYCDPTCMSFDA